jgi:DnaJ-class molecular chaperone
VKRFGGKGKGGEPKKQPELGRKLQTSEEWWSAASTTDRLKWLQCYYGLNSGLVKKVKEEEKDCSTCKGVGTLKATRGTKVVDVICPRCHQAKKDKSVIFW